MKAPRGTPLSRLQNDLLGVYLNGDPVSLPERLIEVASRHTGSEMSVWGHRTPDQTHRVRWFPTKLDLPAHDAAYEALVDQHPVRNHFRATGLPGPHRLSDLVSLSRFKQLGIYQDYFRHFGITRLMAVYLPLGDNTHVSLGVSRGGSDFTDQEMALLDFLRPHIGKAYALAVRLEGAERLLAATEDALAESRHGVIVLNPSGCIEHVTPLAERYVSEFAGLVLKVNQPLPRALAEAIGSNGGKCAVVGGPGGRFRLRRVARPAGDIVMIEGRPAERLRKDFRVLGLTPRESEILGWVCEGKTNAEVAIITHAARGTVRKHLENIYAKLGAENRGAAVRLAQDLVAD